MNAAFVTAPAPKLLGRTRILALGLALLIGSLLLIVLQYITLRSDLITGIELQMRIVADNTVNALQMGDAAVARQTLASIFASPDIDAVALYTAGQQRFASYARNGDTPFSAKLPGNKSLRESGLRYNEIWQPLQRNGQVIGTLYVRANLMQLYQRLLWYVATTTMVMLATLFGAAVLLNRFQRAVAHAEKQAGYLANYDTVTHLPNRYAFNQRLQVSLHAALGNNSTLALLVLDLDDFKVVNDTLGHDVGDALLRLVSQRLLSVVRHEDVIYRVGGDEFAMILTHLDDVEHVANIAEKFIHALTQPVVLGDRNLYIGVSIGASVYPRDGDGVGQLLKNADAAMYHAKSRGKNKFQRFSAEMHHKSTMRLSLEAELREALEQHQFELYYQPQVAFPGLRLVGAEALIRWHHPRKGLLCPGDFIPVAEETGLIRPIGEWVLLTACQHAKSWQEQRFRPMRVSVNISGRQFREDGLIDRVTSILQQTGANPDALELEITESVLMDNAESTVAKLAKLRAMGIHLAIDDFGTGYSSMAYLKRFPVERLKIDRSFIRDIPEDADDVAITVATIQMAHGLKLQVVAEGIETRAQLDFLCERNCDVGQGYLFSRPVDYEKMTEILRAGRIALSS